VSNELSVLPLLGPGGGWLLVTSDSRKPHGAWPIVVFRADHSAEPWSAPQLILDPPENDATRYAYNPTFLAPGREQIPVGVQRERTPY